MRKQHRQLCSLPRSWWTSLKLSIDNCSCSFRRYERCCPCCGAHGNIRGGQSVLYIWGQCLLPICAFSDLGIRTSHWLIALTLTGHSLLLPALTERQSCWEKWDKTAQKSCWYRLPGLDCWVNDPECVNCVADVKEQSERWKDGRFELSNFNVKLTPLLSICSCLGFTVKNLFY